MTDSLKRALKRAACIIPLRWVERYTVWKLGYPLLSYAPDGEDLMLRNIFRKTPRGFYVDVGAHHPVRFSNTNLLFERGWRGINLDALPGSMEAFEKDRPKDINLEVAISKEPQTLTYHSFGEPAFNTFSAELAQSYERQGQRQIAKTAIRTRRLDEVLKQHLPEGQPIDLLSVDVEGYDLEVLESNDWTRYRPTIIAIEDIGFDAENPGASPIFTFLKRQGYHLEIATPKTVFYRLAP